MVGIYRWYCGMNILHVGDAAGMGAVYSNILNKLGHNSVVVTTESSQFFRHGEYYQNTKVVKNDKDLFKIVKKIGDKYDHIIYHSTLEVAQKMDSQMLPSSYVFHGNDLRQQPSRGIDVLEMDSMENVFVTTEDMIKYIDSSIVQVLSRPIDMDLFSHQDRPRQTIGLCLSQKRYFPSIKDLLRKQELGCFMVDRVENRIDYDRMPDALSAYAGYYDFKFRPTHPPTLIPEISTTGLQALACGVPVWTNGMWYNIFPEQHNDENCALELLNHLE
jgi:hypothetical protein